MHQFVALMTTALFSTTKKPHHIPEGYLIPAYPWNYSTCDPFYSAGWKPNRPVETGIVLTYGRTCGGSSFYCVPIYNRYYFQPFLQYAVQLFVAGAIILFTFLKIISKGGLKWCMGTLYLVHCMQMLCKIFMKWSIYMTLACHINWIIEPNIQDAIIDYYPLAYSMIQSLAIFSATAAFQFPLYSAKWFRKSYWKYYMLFCLTVPCCAVFATLQLFPLKRPPTSPPSNSTEPVQIGLQVIESGPFAAVGLLVLVIAIVNALIAIILNFRRMKTLKSDGDQMVHIRSMRRFTISLLFYALIPTLWICPKTYISLQNLFTIFFPRVCPVKLPKPSSIFCVIFSAGLKQTLLQWLVYLDATVVYAHAASTFLLLPAYRQAVLNLWLFRSLRRLLRIGEWSMKTTPTLRTGEIRSTGNSLRRNKVTLA